MRNDEYARNSDPSCGQRLAMPEHLLSSHDSTLGQVIASQSARWPSRPTEDPIWGLVRIVMAQQISTQVACRLAERVKFTYPQLARISPAKLPETASLRAMGLPERRAQCCTTILQRSDEIRAKVQQGQTWPEALIGIKGIGPLDALSVPHHGPSRT